MQASAESGRLKDEATANRRLGRLMCQYWRAAGAFDVKIERLSPPQGKVRLRCVTEPDEAQKVLLHRLGIPLPRRLRRIDEFAQM